MTFAELVFVLLFDVVGALLLTAGIDVDDSPAAFAYLMHQLEVGNKIAAMRAVRTMFGVNITLPQVKALVNGALAAKTKITLTLARQN